MQKRYDEILTARLEDAAYNGCAHLTWQELYLWYDVQRIAAKTRRDLSGRMKEIAGPSAKPRMIAGRGGIFVYDAGKSESIAPSGE